MKAIKEVLALIIVVAGLMIITFSSCTDIIKTSISNLMLLVIGYYFGSSSGSKDKTDIINNLNNGRNNTQENLDGTPEN